MSEFKEYVMREGCERVWKQRTNINDVIDGKWEERFKRKGKRNDIERTRCERLLRELNMWGGRCVKLFSERDLVE